MMNDGGKRVFLIVLTLIFGLLLYMCVDGRDIIRWTADVAYSRGNERVYIERLGDGAIYIGGEGTLYGSDMRALVEGESMTVESVTDIIIGNDITEIGYDVICGYPILRTVRLGDGVTVLGNGSICDCPELQFVFIPAGVQRISRDFLYDCNRCIVITDGPAEGLPKLRNTRKANIIGNVDSFAAMQSAWTNGTELPEILERWWP